VKSEEKRPRSAQLLSDWYISSECWKQIIRKMPVPCVDTIIHKDDHVLLGWRIIIPYRNVWALIGGRMHWGESFSDTSIRNCQDCGLVVQNPQYLGIFPTKFPKGRHDLVICMAARYIGGEPEPTEEFSKYAWIMKSDLDEIHPIGSNYMKMLTTWWKRKTEQRHRRHASLDRRS